MYTQLKYIVLVIILNMQKKKILEKNWVNKLNKL